MHDTCVCIMRRKNTPYGVFFDESNRFLGLISHREVIFSQSEQYFWHICG